MVSSFDYCVIGGGIVGFSTALHLQKKQIGARILLLEKERDPGLHQTGHNSGVIHAGIYYAPDSLKAKLCREGLNATKEFCSNTRIPFIQCGKLIVATNSVELEHLDALYHRAVSNGLHLKQLDGQALKAREPNITGIEALYSPETAIVDFSRVCRAMAEIFLLNGGNIRYRYQVDRIIDLGESVDILSGNEKYKCRKLVVCGGLQSDRLVRLAGLPLDFRIVPFRGEYFQLPSEKNRIINHLIYPVPDPSMPFLGIHLTRMIDGTVTVGPNAVISFARETYQNLSFNLNDTLDFLFYPGFWRLIMKHGHHAAHECYTSLLKSFYLRECQKYCPSLRLNDLRQSRVGVRAQAVSTNGEAIHDFLFKQTDSMLHVCNAPSPAATSALPIGRMIAEKILN